MSFDTMFHRSWIKGGITLTFLLGTTWTIGFAFVSAQTVVMAYAFTILNSLQVSLSFIVINLSYGTTVPKRKLLY